MRVRVVVGGRGLLRITCLACRIGRLRGVGRLILCISCSAGIKCRVSVAGWRILGTGRVEGRREALFVMLFVTDIFFINFCLNLSKCSSIIHFS